MVLLVLLLLLVSSVFVLVCLYCRYILHGNPYSYSLVPLDNVLSHACSYYCIVGHDNCDYDSYENQLERTLTPIMAAANMMTQVQNAGEGGGCGDSHQNQVFCITHNVSPDVGKFGMAFIIH